MTRTGLSTFLFLAHRMCRLFGTYRGSIVGAIDASSASAENKALLHQYVNVVDNACAAIDSIRTVWES